jgi:5-methylcytosine-specific restriction protein A
MSIADLTRDAVLRALAEFDVLGRDAFLAKFGFASASARSDFLLHDGRRYDLKAIAGAAHGVLPGLAAMVPSQFSGGDKTVGLKLTELGFTVADFFANNPWHAALERHSRAIEAERDAQSEGRPIRWYYERVRGQYAEELSKLSTAPQKTAFRNRKGAAPLRRLRDPLVST